MVMLAVPNSHKIAQVFSDLGVEQIFIFNSPFKNAESLEDQTLNFQYQIQCEAFLSLLFYKLLNLKGTLSEAVSYSQEFMTNAKMAPNFIEWFKGKENGGFKI